MLKRLMRLTLLTLLLGLTTYTVVLQQEDVTETDPVLTADATLDEIINALLTAEQQYTTIHIRIVNQDHVNGHTGVNEIWMDRSQNAYRWETTFTSAEGDVSSGLEVADGEYRLMPFADGPLVMEMNMAPDAVAGTLGLISTIIAPQDVAVLLGAPSPAVEELGMPERERNFEVEIVGVETISDRETIKIVYEEGRRIDFWIDTQTGILMQYQNRTPDGEVTSTKTVDAVMFDPVLQDPETLFNVDMSYYDPDRLNDFFLQPPTEQP